MAMDGIMQWLLGMRLFTMMRARTEICTRNIHITPNIENYLYAWTMTHFCVKNFISPCGCQISTVPIYIPIYILMRINCSNRSFYFSSAQNPLTHRSNFLVKRSFLIFIQWLLSIFMPYFLIRFNWYPLEQSANRMKRATRIRFEKMYNSYIYLCGYHKHFRPVSFVKL